MPIDPKKYPEDWKVRSRFVRFYRAKNHCEWCGAANYKPHPETGSKVVLTTAHVHDKDPMAASLLNLAALCQRCHLNHDKSQHRETRNKAKVLNFPTPQTAREFVRLCILKGSTPQKNIAKAMGLSQSDLTRKLAQSPDDSRRFTLDDLENYIQATGDKKPIFYLVEKYLADEDKEELKRQIAALQERLK